jgi:hypothetical protein
MELDLQSLFGLHVHRRTHWLRPRNSPPPPLPPHWGSYTRALLVSQDSRHLFVTPWLNISTQHSCSCNFSRYFYIFILDSYFRREAVHACGPSARLHRTQPAPVHWPSALPPPWAPCPTWERGRSRRGLWRWGCWRLQRRWWR